MNLQNLTYLMCFSPLQLLSLLILRMISSLVSGGLFKLAVHTFDVTNSLIASLVSSVIRYELPWWHSGKDLNPHDYIYGGFPGGASAEDTGSIPGLGSSPGGGNGRLLQYSCLGNPMDRGARWSTVHVVSKESDTT